jgi:hypothetical protein
MSIDGETFKNLGNINVVSGVVTPPTDFQIQTQFPSYGFVTGTANYTPIATTFKSHSGNSNQGDEKTFQVQVNSAASQIVTAYFYIGNNYYYMSLDGIYFSNIGKVEGTLFGGANPPTNTQIQSQFQNYWLASGTEEINQQKTLFSSHSGSMSYGDGQYFPIHVFKGPQ